MAKLIAGNPILQELLESKQEQLESVMRSANVVAPWETEEYWREEEEDHWRSVNGYQG